MVFIKPAQCGHLGGKIGKTTRNQRRVSTVSMHGLHQFARTRVEFDVLPRFFQ